MKKNHSFLIKMNRGGWLKPIRPGSFMAVNSRLASPDYFFVAFGLSR